MQRVQRDGVTLAYEETGSGSPPILLVHGWTCDHTYFAPQFEHLGKDHRVVAVDLRGHGESDKPDQPYTMDLFADDLAWLCGQLHLEKPVVIGHSMGGVIALVLAAHYPDLPAAIVTVDAPIVLQQALREALAPLLPALRSPESREAARNFISEVLFLPTDEPELKTRIVEAMTSAPQHVMASAMEGILSCDTAAAAAACKVPVLNLCAANPLPNLDAWRQLCPQLVNGQTVGAGHFHQLLVPDQVNAMIDRFLALTFAAPVAAGA